MKFIGDEWAKGNGIFETIRVEDNQAFALHRHHCRAIESAKRLGFEIPPEPQVADESYQVIRSCGYPLGRLRWHFDKGGEFSISYSQFKDPTEPANLMVLTQRSEEYGLKLKEYPYKNLELLEAVKAKGFDDGIILTADGQLSESTVASLLFKINNEWVTPPLSSGILNGVVRALVIEAGLAAVRRIDESELLNIEAGFLLTSLRNAQSIGSIEGRKLEIDLRKREEIHKLMATFKGK